MANIATATLAVVRNDGRRPDRRSVEASLTQGRTVPVTKTLQEVDEHTPLCP